MAIKILLNERRKILKKWDLLLQRMLLRENLGIFTMLMVKEMFARQKWLEAEKERRDNNIHIFWGKER